MKTKVAILILISLLLASCAPETAMQESKVEVATEAPVIKAQMTQEPVFTEEPISTELPTEASTETPPPCVTLLTPISGAEIPPGGKVTFSWTPMNEVGKYILNITLPSGEAVSFETDQTFRDRYMEAFVAGGEYQWQVVVQGADGSEICVSEVSTFDKAAYEKPKSGGGEGGQGADDCPPDNCGGGGEVGGDGDY